MRSQISVSKSPLIDSVKAHLWSAVQSTISNSNPSTGFLPRLLTGCTTKRELHSGRH